jgi:hypothetical protein
MEHPEWANRKDTLHVSHPIEGYKRRKIQGESWADVAVQLSELLTSDRFHRVQHDRLAERDRQHFWDQLKAAALRLFDASSKERKDHNELREKLEKTRLDLERVRAELERAKAESLRGEAGQAKDTGKGTASAAGMVGQEALQKCLADKKDAEKSRDGWMRAHISLKKDHDATVGKLSTLQQQYSQDIPTQQKKPHDEYDKAIETLKRQFAKEVEKTCAKERAELAECHRAYAAGLEEAAASLAFCQQAGRESEARLVASRDESAANKVALESCASSKVELEKQLAQLRTRHAEEIESLKKAEKAMQQLREQHAQEIARLKREHEESFVRTIKNLKDTYSQAAGYDKTQLAECLSARSDLGKVVSALKAMYKHP